MGNCCAAAKPKPQDGTDLPVANLTTIKDPIERFEKQSFPFYRMHVLSFQQLIYQFGRETFSIAELKERLPGAAWDEALKSGSKTVEFLMQLPGSEASENEPLESILKVQTMVALSVVFCGGSLRDKAEALFQCVNPPGEAQDKVAFNDSGFNSLDIMFEIATLNIVAFANKKGVDYPPYEDEELAKRAI